MAVDGLLVVLDRQNRVVQSESVIDWRGVFGSTAPPSGETFSAVNAALSQPNGAFEIADFSYDTHINTGGGTAASSKVAFDPLSVSMKVDKATSLFFQNLAAHAEFNSIDLVLEKVSGGGTAGPSGLAYCVLGFGTVFGHTFAMSYDDESPNVSLSFTYQQMQIAYRQQNPDGTFGSWVIRGWDRETNTAI